MTARCKKCNQCEWFDPRDEWGIKIKLSEQVCECGGKFERVRPIDDYNLYANQAGKIFELTAIGEFRTPKNPTP